MNETKLPDDVKNIIFVAEGGIGRAIASTAIVAKIKQAHPDKRIIVVTGYPDIFLYNPHVFKVFNFGNPLYFYDDYVTKESYLMHVEPYRHHGYLHGERHLIDVWCEMLGLDPTDAKPELYFLKKEEEAGKLYVDKLTENGKKKFVLFQWVGGIIPKEKNAPTVLDSLGRMHKRSLPQNVAQKIVNKLVTRKLAVGIVQHENFPDLDEAERVCYPIRNVLVLLKYSQGFIGIDSFIQHAARAMNVPGVVCWGGTNPSRLGYPMHKNLNKTACSSPNCHRPNSYIFDANPSGFIWNCPFDEVCMNYDADEIIAAYEELTNGKKGE